MSSNLMFIGSFQNFRGESNSGRPQVIATVAAGQFHSSITDKEIFEDNGYQIGKLYLCTNVPAIDRETKERIVVTNQTTGAKSLAFNVQVISEISPMDLISMLPTLGAAKRLDPVTPGKKVVSTPDQGVVGEKVLSHLTPEGEVVEDVD